MTTNYSTAVFLINPNVRAVKAIYEAIPLSGPMQPETIFKTFDKSLKKGDLVLVPTQTRHCMTVVKITEVDVEVDPDTSTQIDWIIGLIDTTQYLKTLEQESDAIKIIKSAKATKKRADLAKELLADQDPASLKLLPIATRINGE